VSLWKHWTSGLSGVFGPCMAMQAWLARDVAQRLGTTVGPDDDVRWQGRLVSVAPFVPDPQGLARAAGLPPDDPSDDEVVTCLERAATKACDAIRSA